jgi:predicted ATPase
MLISGESGIGKSALCAAYLTQLRAAMALQRIFPVLSRIETSTAAQPRPASDAQALRRRGFSAFAQLLARMRERDPVVIHLDDLQWSDADSTRLLMHLLHAPDAPPLLWILSHRNQQHEDHPHLSPLYRELPQVPSLDVRSLLLGPLSAEAARALLSTPLTGLEDEVAGNPFLLGELARHAALRTRFMRVAAAAQAYDEKTQNFIAIAIERCRGGGFEIASIEHLAHGLLCVLGCI